MSESTAETTDRFVDDVVVQQVGIRHKETGAVGTCPIGAVEFWESRGYERVTDDEVLAAQGDPTIGDPTSTPIVEDSTAAGSYDPSEHSAKEVAGYLASLDTATPAGQAEYDRVVAAEQAGQNRSSALPS